MKLTPLLLYVFVVLRNVNALDPPADLSWTEARSTFFVITWTVVEDVSYKVFVKLDSGSEPPSSPPDNAVDAKSPYNVTHISSGNSIIPYTQYSFHVYAIKGKKKSHADFDGLSTAPPAPTDITITSDSSSQLTVSWVHDTSTPSQCIGGRCHIVNRYQVTYSDGATSNDAFADLGTGTKHTLPITGLTSNTAYSVNVFAMTLREGKYSDASETENADTAFSQPTSTSATSSSSSTIDVTWTSPPGGGNANSIIGYTVSWSTGAEGPSTLDVDASPYTIPSLNPNTAYSISVLARSAAGDGDKSNFAATTVFGPVASLSTTSSSSSIDVSWTGPGVGGNAKKVSEYIITWSPPNSEGVISHNAAATATKYTIPNLDSNTDYDVKIYAKSDSGNGDESDETQTTVPLQASQPRNSSNPTISSITLQWTPVSGDSPSLNYNVSWTSSGPTGFNISRETSATIDGLTASTRYNFTVTAVNDGGSADPSDPAMFSTVPNQLEQLNLSRPSTNPTTQINVEWNKPSGVDDIVDYVVDWWLSSSDGSMTSSGIVTGPTTSSYTIEGLTPGETYDVTVKARNSAGSGQPSTSVKHITNPDSVKNVSITQNSTSPEKLLDLTWELTTNGTGDNITIEYNDTTGNVTENISVDFSLSQTTLSVVPGITYTVIFTVYSNGVASERVYDYANSKPSEPSFDVEAFTNELLVTWIAPEGYYDGLAILLSGNKAIEVEDGNPQIIDGLDPYTDYKVEMYSWIINVKGEVERSRTSPRTCKTLPGPPPVPSPDSSLTEDAESSANTITFVLPPNTFSETNGPIEYYAVYLSIGDQEKLVPDVTSFSTCQDLASGDECVTLWTDSEGNPASQGSENILRDLDASTRQSAPIIFLIGNNTETYSPLNEPFISYPLQPNTAYRVAVGAKTANKQMTATVWGSEIKTSKKLLT
ncbi:receptor-type tyrosine-protein phosphatase F-like [Clavelina lepadiformis]|uniref:receptor-type tyrosine-protein phosphatase F-like n=1 Tax=Clavelina lepadiformis TaxID=159417 RepID=UPI00404320A3